METLKKYGGYLLTAIIFVLSIAAVVFQRKEKPQPDAADTFKGDRLEDKVQIAPIQAEQEHIVETLKPVPKTESKDMASAIDAWKKAGD
jgi:hypothetical protein